MVPHAEPLGEQRLAEFRDFLLVEMQGHEGARPLQEVLQSNHLPLSVESSGLNDIEGFIENHLLPLSQLPHLD